MAEPATDGSPEGSAATDPPADGPGEAGGVASASDAATTTPDGAAERGPERTGADRDKPAPPDPGPETRAGAEQDEPTTYDPANHRPLRHEREQGKRLFSGTAFDSRQADSNSGQVAQGDHGHAIGTVHGNMITTVNVGVVTGCTWCGR